MNGFLGGSFWATTYGSPVNRGLTDVLPPSNTAARFPVVYPPDRRCALFGISKSQTQRPGDRTIKWTDEIVVTDVRKTLFQHIQGDNFKRS